MKTEFKGYHKQEPMDRREYWNESERKAFHCVSFISHGESPPEINERHSHDLHTAIDSIYLARERLEEMENNGDYIDGKLSNYIYGIIPIDDCGLMTKPQTREYSITLSNPAMGGMYVDAYKYAVEIMDENHDIIEKIIFGNQVETNSWVDGFLKSIQTIDKNSMIINTSGNK